MAKDDDRYYIHCPKRRDQGKVPVTRCLEKCRQVRREGNRIVCAWSSLKAARAERDGIV